MLAFRLLGPVEVYDGKEPLRLSGAKQRSLLALLLLNADEVVSADRLVDELWGDTPPDDAPTALQQHVSRLRRALGPHAVIVTRSPGYVLELGDAELDLREFETRRDEGRALLQEGDFADAAARLQEALALWRGRPLSGAEGPSVDEAIARLDEAWIEATELRIDAELALRRHAELIADLEALVRRHPLRERLRAHLMLALYRAGRQTEALAVYDDARRSLVDELGLEPGPELQRLHVAILNQDPSLELQLRRAAAARRRWWPALAVVAVAGAIAGLVAVGGEDEPAPPTAPRHTGGELVALDIATGEVRRRLPAGRTPSSIAATPDGRLWVVDADARTLLAVDPTTDAVETLATGATPTEVAAGADGVWVANGRPRSGAQFAGPLADEIVHLDPATRTQRAAVPLPTAGRVFNVVENRVAVSADAVWAVTPSGAVARIDPQTDAITETTRALGVLAVAAGGAGVWAVRESGGLLRLDERVRAQLPTDFPTAVAVGDTAAWATSSIDGMLWRVDAEGDVGAVELGSGVTDIAVTAERVWVANPGAGTITAVDPAQMRVVQTVRVGGVPRSLAVAGDTLWVTASGAEPAQGQRAAGVTTMPASVCGPVVAGPDGADVLLVSDLPLQGGIRITATQMAQAVTFVLRERGFRAGRFRVAYQSCDDSIARTGLFDEAKCAANARAYARNDDVVAVIGPLNSPCAVAAVPELNRGGVPAVSPLASFVGLTRTGPGIDPGLLARLYPTGTRTFLRVFPTDDLQGAALATLARDRGHERVFVLDDGEPGYGVLMAEGFETAAQGLGLEVAGRATYDPGARSYRRLAARIAASGAGAAFIGGLLDSNAAAVVRALRAAAPDVDVMGPDGLTPLPLLREAAGPAAEGVFVSLGGVLTERLPPAGAAWARRFVRTQAGVAVEPSAVYAAQATEVVLDALGRSDGTRASLLEALFGTRISGGLLGDVAFDERGDITESPVTIMRVQRPGTSDRQLSVEGGVIERVVRVAG